jgi:hypothetical protein
MLRVSYITVILLILFTSIAYCANNKNEVVEKITISTFYPSPYGSYNELQSNKMAVGDTNRDGQLSADDQPAGEGQLQVSRSVIFTPLSGTPSYDVREGEVVYDASNKSLRYFNGANWQPLGGLCYTQYCYNPGSSYGSVSYGTPVCPSGLIVLGVRGPCENGFVLRKSLGAWGYCHNDKNNQSYFLPPGGTCGPASLNYSNGFSYRIGQAYLCCQ